MITGRHHPRLVLNEHPDSTETNDESMKTTTPPPTPPVIGYRNGVPIIACRRESAKRRGDCDLLVFDCPQCCTRHSHNACGGNGHRLAHCRTNNPWRHTGYILQEVGGADV